MSTVNKQDVNYNLINTQDAEDAIDTINQLLDDEATTALINALSNLPEDADLSDLEELTNGAVSSEELGQGSVDDETMEQFVNSLVNAFNEADNPDSSLNSLMLQLIAALQIVQQKGTEAGYAMSQAHTASSLANAKSSASNYKQDLHDLSKKHHWWSKALKVTKNWVAPITLLVVGVLTENPALIVAGTMLIVSTQTPAMSAMTNEASKGFTGLFNAIPGVPQGVADKLGNVMGAITTVVLVTALTAGVGGIATAEVAGEEAAGELGAELGGAAEGLSATGATAEAEASTVVERVAQTLKDSEFNMKKVKSFAKLGFAMSLGSESATISKGLVQFIPESDPLARKIVGGFIEATLIAITGYAGYQGAAGLAAEAASDATSTFSKIASEISAPIAEAFGEGAGYADDEFVSNTLNLLSSAGTFAADNSRVILGISQIISGLAQVGLSGEQFSLANVEEQLGQIQANLAILSSTEQMNEQGLDQVTQDLQSFFSTTKTETELVASSVGKNQDGVAAIEVQ